MSWWRTWSDNTSLQMDLDDRVEATGLCLDPRDYCNSLQRFENEENNSVECRPETLEYLRNQMQLCVLLNFLGYNLCDIDCKENRLVDKTIGLLVG